MQPATIRRGYPLNNPGERRSQTAYKPVLRGSATPAAPVFLRGIPAGRPAVAHGAPRHDYHRHESSKSIWGSTVRASEPCAQILLDAATPSTLNQK